MAEQSASEQLVRRHFDGIWNKKNMQVVEQTCAPDFEMMIGKDVLRGQEDLRDAVRAILTAFPDIHFTIDDLFAAQDHVCVRWTGKGVHRGEFLGVAPTNKPMSYWGVSIYEMRNGRIARQWGTADIYTLVAELRGEAPLHLVNRAA
jgi:steroid delta-isomerase-like uncharacterized protein